MAKHDPDVARALEADDIPAAVAALDTAEQLDQLMRTYDVNDGFLPVLAVVSHPRCDEGTALFAYFSFVEVLGEPPDADEPEPDPRWDHRPVLALLDARFARRDFASASIAYDPVKDLGLDEESRASLIESGVHPDRFLAVGPR